VPSERARDWINDSNVALLNDLYEFTMAASYCARGMNWDATFDLAVRSMPSNRNFLVAAGLEQALHFLETFHFDREAIDALSSLQLFNQKFLSTLGTLRFTGEVWAVPEGELVFAGEPLLRVTAPLIEAQLVEPFLLNCITFQTMVASKAARLTLACAGRPFYDFSLRRDHGADAAMKAARAGFIAGAAGTSNVLAGSLYGIPLSGTMAHSYVMTFGDEISAFESFARDFPERAILLIDTFDVLEGTRHAIRVALRLRAEGISIRGVRIDGGDLVEESKQVRGLLDAAGLREVIIVASGDLDEHRIAHALAAGAPVDAFGVGTHLGTSADAPYLNGIYKLAQDAHGPKIKLSPGKATLPGRKQILRFERDGRYLRDLIALEDERIEGARPLLRRVMQRGQRIEPAEPLPVIRDRCAVALTRMPPELASLRSADSPYPVAISSGLSELDARARAHFSRLP